MEGIEESQINDHSIMDATVIERQDHSGRIMFKTVLPSGRALNSEWVQESDKAKAGILWTEAVRGQIVQDSQEAAAQARKTLKERRATQAAAAPSLIGANGQTLSPASLATVPTIHNTGNSAPSAAISAPADPSQYVKVQYLAAQSLSSFLSGEAARINQELTAAKKAEAQWFGLFQAMGGSVDEVVSKGGSSNSVISGINVAGEGRDGLFGSVVISTAADDSAPDAGDSEWEDDTNGALDAGR